MSHLVARPAADPPGGLRGPVAVLGAGTIGAGWAACFALQGLEVRVFDQSPQAGKKVLDALAQARPIMSALGLRHEAAMLPRVTASLSEAVCGAQHVQEALPESLLLKQEIYAGVEAFADAKTIIASSSSGILPSDLQAGLRHPQRLVIAHPCNPPYLMPMVEIAGGSLTADWALAQAERFYQQLGKKTIRLRREVKGHLINRLQAALWREAVHLVAQGYASVSDVDRAVTEGLGVRWSVCGPHMIFHLSDGDAGMAGFLEKLGPAVQSWWQDLGNPVLDGPTRQALTAGMLEAAHGKTHRDLSQERDARMISILKALQPSDSTPEL